jgi:hypothetical protein
VIPFHYIVLIDRKQSGQTLFLKALSRDLANQQQLRGLFIHGDNERTEHLLQEGFMRDQARKRVTRETSRRLVDVFAEAGVSCVSMEISQLAQSSAEGEISVDKAFHERIPGRTHLILSNLADADGRIIELEKMASELSKLLAAPVLKITNAEIQGIFVEAADQNTKEISSEQAHIQYISIKDWSKFEELFPQ